MDRFGRFIACAMMLVFTAALAVAIHSGTALAGNNSGGGGGGENKLPGENYFGPEETDLDVLAADVIRLSEGVIELINQAIEERIRGNEDKVSGLLERASRLQSLAEHRWGTFVGEYRAANAWLEPVREFFTGSSVDRAEEQKILTVFEGLKKNRRCLEEVKNNKSFTGGKNQVPGSQNP